MNSPRPPSPAPWRPTITTQCNGFGNGRFGHPEQDRAISLREAALLQTFPPGYEFFHPDERWPISAAARCIGNAVPVALARAVARSVARTLNGGQNGLRKQSARWR